MWCIQQRWRLYCISNCYNDKYNYGDRPLDIAVDPAGNVVVAGQSMVAPDEWAYVTVRYVAHTLVMPVDSDSVSTSLRFLANRDQLLGTDGNAVERVRFYSNQCYPNVYMMDDSLSYVFAHIDDDTTTADTMHRVDMSFVGGNAEAKLLPIDKEAYFNNYYLGHIPEGRPFVSLYKHLYMQDVWTGIDMEYSSNQRGLKYYFIVHPGIEPSLIGLRYDGQDDLSVDGNGALVMQTTVGTLVQPQALAYEMDGSGELTLLGWQPDYVVSSGVVSFDGIGSYSGDLVIEVNWGYVGNSVATIAPEWGTYYGGTSSESCTDMVVDENENLFVLGNTSSQFFPTMNPFQGNLGGGQDAFVGKVLNTNYGLSWMTYFGGDGDDDAYDIASSQINDRVFFCGKTQFNSAPLPTYPSSGAFTEDYGYNQGANCGYIAALARNNGFIQWLTYFGGDDFASCNGIKTDRFGDIYVVGSTQEEDASSSCSPNGSFPLCNTLGASFMQVENQRNDDLFTPCRGTDGFIAKFENNLTLVWSTYFGGNGRDELLDLAIDNSYDKVYLVGITESARSTPTYCLNVSVVSTIPLMDAGKYYQFQLNGDNDWYPLVNWDGIIARFTFGGDLEWSSFFGGGGNEEITSIATEPDGDVLIAGRTNTSIYDFFDCLAPIGSGFPRCSSANKYFQAFGGGDENFVARFDRFTELQWCTYLGSDGVEGINPKIVSDNSGNKFVISTINFESTAPDWLLPNAFYYEQSSSGGSGDIFICGFDSNDEITYGSYFGGNGAEYGTAIAMTATRVFLGGGTASSTGFPLNDFDPAPFSTDVYYGAMAGGFTDAFFAQIEVPFLVEASDAHTIPSNGLTVYPNPSGGKFTVDWESKGKGATQIDVYDLLGHCIFSKRIFSNAGGNQQFIDLSALSSGIFCIVVNDNGLKKSQKIIKQ